MKKFTNLDFAIIFLSLISKSVFDLNKFLTFLRKRKIDKNLIEQIKLFLQNKDNFASKTSIIKHKYLNEDEEKLIKKFLRLNKNKFFMYYKNTIPTWANFENNLEDSVIFSNRDLNNLKINAKQPVLLLDEKNQRISNFENQENFIQQLVSVSYVKNKETQIDWNKIFYVPFEKPLGKYAEKEEKMRFLAEKKLIQNQFINFSVDFNNIWNNLILISNRAYIWDLKYFIISDKLITKDNNGYFKFNKTK
ncbi:hypothetical protein [Mesomycoplasma hyorhinis]|uniref:hypothetical protein n=1 Tax=Mesomycoplasma hyorhinis TaxID=2100 RepID=UPI001C03FA7A|nr:hypothetical protein [Mesomycoplasma hyorhinis]